MSEFFEYVLQWTCLLLVAGFGAAVGFGNLCRAGRGSVE